MLREHFSGNKRTRSVQLALSHNAGVLGEQVRKRALVNARHVLVVICHREARRDAVTRRCHGTLLHHAAHTERVVMRRFARGNLSR